MKKLLLCLAVSLLTANSQAQFTKATLQATGLTCAMCSNAINKALQKVPFVESVRSDIKNSAFNIVFRQNENVDIDALKDAVEGAGFSIGSLQLTGTFKDVKIANEQHVLINERQFCFLDVSSQTLNGEKTLTVVDKNFVTEKKFKKISSSTKMSCLQTGKSAPCCGNAGVSANTRVYHVTI
jgi:copper chaperone CopZ